MINISKAQKIIERRFNEVFLIDPDKLSEEDFDYYTRRVADFYKITKDKHPAFFDLIDKKMQLINDKLSSEYSEINENFKHLQGVIDRLSINDEFSGLVKKGEEIYKNKLGIAHSLADDEIIFQSYSFTLKLLKSDMPKIAPTLSESKKIALDFNSLLYALKSLGKDGMIENYEKELEKNNELLDLINRAEDKAYLEYDYARIHSIREIENIWNFYYGKKERFSIVGLKLHIAKDNLKNSTGRSIYSAKRICEELKIDLQRFYHEFLDWLEEQNFLEESLVSFRTWAEVVNNDLFSNMEDKNEEKLKFEFSKYVFSAYNILVIREPTYGRKRPDFLINQIIGEAKYLNGKFTKRKVISTIKDGIRQINNYAKIFPYVEGAVLVLFNFNASFDLTPEIMTEIYKGKPLTILPININSVPSKSTSISYGLKDIQEILNSL